ncbi:MAG TPA: V-type ATP synthase subunit K [Deltaproteobacteria bacterium]|jgi:V/A-type H+-transporting ATPase subunit K|nr:V-type ATP synthase subunit K [Deltaproteobacteria bacterium]
MRVRYAALALGLLTAFVVAIATVAGAQQLTRPSGVGVGAGLMGLGAAIAIGLGALGTGIAQSRIGSAAAGVVAERPEMFGLMLIFLVIPETLVIFGFVIAFFLYGKI